MHSRMAWVTARLAKRHILQREEQIILLLTLVIGALVGLVIVAFILLTENLGAKMYPPGSPVWRRLLIPVAGALLTGFFLYRYFPDARGSGIPQTKAAFFLRDGFISFRTVLGRFTLSSVSMASGISLGREGPSVQIGAGVASILGRWLGLSQTSVRSLVPIGASAALAAAFNTPVAAVLFSLEQVMGDIHAPVLGSIVLSSATSWIVLHLVLGDEPLFHVPQYQFVHPFECGAYALLGLAGGVVSVVFIKLLLWQRMWFRRLPPRTEWAQPVAGGLLVGLLGCVLPEVLGVGYGYVGEALNGQLVLGTMALLVVLKVVATATCYSSGNAGGIFGPSLFIGAMLGGTLGSIVHRLAPDYTGSIGAYALVGMGAAFAGIIRVPLTSVVMIFEITRDYSIIVPLMISNLISYYISCRLHQETVYEAVQHQEGIYLPASAREHSMSLPVSRAVRHEVDVLSADVSVIHALESVDLVQQAWPVMGPQGLLGVVTLPQLEQAVANRHEREPLGSVVPPSFPRQRSYLYPDEPLDAALRHMSSTGLPLLPVVSRANVRQMIGAVSLPDIMAAYGLSERRNETEQPAQPTHAPKRKLNAAVAALLLFLVLTGLLSYLYRVQRKGRADEHFRAGNGFIAAARYPEAIEEYRKALSISHRAVDRFALATALLKAGRTNEAEVYFRQLARDSSNSGRANLGLGRIALRQGRTSDAIADYHRAIYGSWPENTEENRIEARIELAEALSKAGRQREAQEELLALPAEIPKDAAIENRVGRLLLDHDLPNEAATVFQDVIARNPQDAEAYTGLGASRLARGDYKGAESACRIALRMNPRDSAAKQQLELCTRVMALDPTVRDLNPEERDRRSRILLEAALSALDACLASHPKAWNESVGKVLSSARQALSSKPPSTAEAFDANISLAEQVWSQRSNFCDTPENPEEEAVESLLQRLAR